MRRILFILCLVSVLAPSAARADILFYYIGGLGLRFEGEAKIETKGTVTFRHPHFGTFYFGIDRVQYYDAPSTGSLAKRMLGRAEGDQQACLEAARWCLHHGMLEEFYEAASMAWRLDRTNPTVQRLAKLKRMMDTPLPIHKEQEEQMRKYIKTNDDMEFVRSDHFLLMHNTKAPELKGRKKRRLKKHERQSPAERRLELLEKVYESFLIKFYLEGLELELPKKRLMVVLFADKADFLAYCESTDDKRTKMAGLYDKRSNIAVFYAQGTDEGFKELDDVRKEIAQDAETAKRMRSSAAKVLVRYSKTVDLLIDVAKLNQDIEVVSHECTHQMAANTGLMPNESHTPVWVAEGIATYFESPKEAAWAGIGTVNEGRLSLYRTMSDDTTRSSVEYIASDKIFMLASTDEEHLHVYGQSWALTHYLMKHDFERLMKFYKLLADRRPKDKRYMFPPNENIEAFKKVFGDDLNTINAKWRRYMRGLKTDVELVVDSAKK